MRVDRKAWTVIFVAAILSCSKMENKEELRLNETQVILTASAEQPNNTKTVRQSDGQTFWMPGDQISLFYGSGDNGGSIFTSLVEEPQLISNFTGSIGVITGGNEIKEEDTFFWGLYPYDATASVQNAQVTTTLKTEQVAVQGSFPNKTFISLGRAPGLNMGFYNVCSGIKFSVSTEKIKSVTLRGNNNEKIAGKIVIGFGEDGKPLVKDYSEGATEVVLSAPDGEFFEVGKYYYLVTIPQVFEGGFTIRFDTVSKYAERTYTSKITLKRSIFGSLGDNIDKNLTWITKGVPFKDKNFEGMMLLRFDKNEDGVLSFEEAEEIDEINGFDWYFNSDADVSLSGIEYCKNLTRLNLDSRRINVYDLDLSAFPKLESLQSLVREVRFTGDPASFTLPSLKYLALQFTPVLDSDGQYRSRWEALNVKGSTQLISLSLTLGGYSEIIQDLTIFPNLKILEFGGDTRNSHLNVSLVSQSLEILTCGGSPVTGQEEYDSFDVSGCPSLKKLIWQGSKNITRIDVSNNHNLEELEAYGNITELLLPESIKTLWCPNNNLTSLDLSSCPSLEFLQCYGNSISSLNVSKNTKLTTLDCSPMPTLTYLYVGKNQTIDGITTNRNPELIPETTTILEDSETGGNEGTGEEPIG